MQYRPEIKAQAMYFNRYHHIPLMRTREILSELFDSLCSEGTLIEICKQAAELVTPVDEQAMAHLIQIEAVAHLLVVI